MSIHVTVTGNPVYLGRGKLLLTDIETAKKNEWLRRRKIRLQQARQQAKDLSQNVRKKVYFREKNLEENEEEEKISEQNKIQKEHIISLENEFQKSVSSVGTGHQLASIQRECEALEREKQDLRETIAKARGVIAEEKLKADKLIQKEKTQATIERRQMTRKFENLRSALVSKQPELKSSISQTKKSIKSMARQNNEALEGGGINNRRVVSPSRRFVRCNKPLTRSSLSPPRSKNGYNCSSYCQKKSEIDNEEENPDEEESDDSDITWPPRSARVTKESLLPPEPPKVRFYDHSTRVMKSDPRPTYSITPVDPFDDLDMAETIAEEEEAIVRKENLDILARRERMIRGNKALRKERGKKEAVKFIKELREMQRKEKIQTAVNRTYPCDLHKRDVRRKEIEAMKYPQKLEGFAGSPPLPTSPPSNRPQFKSCYLQNAIQQIDPDSPKNVRPDSSTDNEDFFEELISKLKVERAKKQHVLESKCGMKDASEGDVPRWAKCQEMTEDAGPSGVKMIPLKQDRAVSPVNYDINNSCSCSFKCTCKQSGGNGREQRAMSPKFTPSENTKQRRSKDNKPGNISPRGDVETAVSMQKDDNNQPVSIALQSPLCSIVESEVEKVSSKSSSQSDTVESSLTFEGIKVTVKVCEKTRKKKDRLSGEQCLQMTDKDVQTSLETSEESPTDRHMSWKNRFSNSDAPSSGSTSYMSPPNKLSPAHQTLLRAILNEINARNKNPRLHHYIKKVLEMSRKSIDELPVSSVSDISVNSSIFEHSPRRRPKSLDSNEKHKKCSVSCQAEISCSDDSAAKDEALKFSELAENYAHRLQNLAGMMEKMRILPDATRYEEIGEDSSAYLSPPAEVCQSVRLSQSVVPGVYPHCPCDDSNRIRQKSLSPHLDLPPTHIHPHPSNALHLHPTFGPTAESRNLQGKGPVNSHELSTIQECGESQRPETPQFDLDISSIGCSPQQHQERRDSAGSSLCLLDDRDISSWLGSSDDYEEVFRSLGIGWALPTVRKTRQSKRRGSGSSRSSGRGQYSHSTPLGLSPAKMHSQQQHPTSTDSDSLTPPNFSLNIPGSVWPCK